MYHDILKQHKIVKDILTFFKMDPYSLFFSRTTWIYENKCKELQVNINSRGFSTLHNHQLHGTIEV